MKTYQKATSISPALGAFLQRHLDRLVSDELPKGIWTCEEDGEPLIVLLAYTEPHLRVSVIMDEPSKSRFMSLERLARSFESWAKENAITHYCVVVPESDDWYAVIIERRGAIELGRSNGWIEYLHQIDPTPQSEDGLHLWTPGDWKALRPLMAAFLEEHCRAGGDFLPTRRNVEAFIRRGVKAAAQGDPCLLAIQDGKIVGFCLWAGIDAGDLDLRDRICQGLGTYVVPTARRQGWSKRIRARALEVAAEAGYTRVDGVAIDKRGLAAGKAAGFATRGVQVRYVLPRVEEDRKVA